MRLANAILKSLILFGVILLFGCNQNFFLNTNNNDDKTVNNKNSGSIKINIYQGSQKIVNRSLDNTSRN